MNFVAFICLQNIGILHHKKAKLPKHLQQSVDFLSFFYILELLEELARDYMKEMLERICIEADVSDSPLLGILRGAKNLAEIQEILRNMMNDQKVGSAFKRQVAFLFDFEEIEHTTVAGLAMQDILKDAKHKLR